MVSTRHLISATFGRSNVAGPCAPRDIFPNVGSNKRAAGTWLDDEVSRKCAVAKTCVAGQVAAPVGSMLGKVALSRCAVGRIGEAGQGAAPVGSGLGQVASKCAVVGTGESGHVAAPVGSGVVQLD